MYSKGYQAVEMKLIAWSDLEMKMKINIFTLSLALAVFS
jgi:hypothetical protein